MATPTPPPPPALVVDDPWLEPYAQDLRDRIGRYEHLKQEIETQRGGLEAFTRAYTHLGINYDADAEGWWYREWAPAAEALFLIGDFNGWNRSSHPLTRGENGVWEIFLPDDGYKDLFTHGSLVKVHIVAAESTRDRLPAYIKRTVQDEDSKDFAGQVWHSEFKWTDAAFDAAAAVANPIIYEAHVGMAQEKEGLGTYREFADVVLPRVVDGGYNVLQLMAIQEHPYYGSFGYHVSSFFAPSSRFGTPEDLKYLINKAHEAGVAVIMDIVHSHAVKNIAEGLADFDGSNAQYFHGGGRGYHNQWDSKLFDYGKPEVQQFLLSNVRYWLEEFHFDGYRFDGITSLMYFHHGDFVSFDHYDKYFNDVDWDALLYMQLANDVAHSTRPHVLTIAEDMSGMPGLCRQPEEGGVGFDFRLGMGIPDFWIKYLKEKRDEDWSMEEIWWTLVNRRYKERTIAYAESHDQAIVGDKTTAFWLMDKEMYYHMQVDDQNMTIDRGIALHKLLRMVTMSLGGEGYLTFIGNEFGHPEWIDFPREGNGWSYKYARRQWSLADREELKYKYLLAWDKAMVTLLKAEGVLAAGQAQQLNMDTNNRVIIFKRGSLLFVFSFHWDHSVENYRFYVPEHGDYKIVLSSDDPMYGGFNRVDTSLTYSTNAEEEHPHLNLYVTNRTVLVLKKQ